MTTTDSTAANIDLVRQGFEAFGRADMQALSQLIDERATWTASPVGVLPGNCPDRNAMFAYFGQLGQETAGTFSSVPVAMAASGDKVFVQTKTSGQRKGRSLETSDVLVFTVRDEKVRNISFFVGEIQKAQEFWG